MLQKGRIVFICTIIFWGLWLNDASAQGIITTIAGVGLRTDNGDGGLAVNSMILYSTVVCLDASNNVYFNDGNVIRKVDAATGIINTVVGSATAQVPGIGGMRIDAGGNLYMSQNNCIWKIDVSGNARLIAGSVSGSGYWGDNGPATDALLSGPGGIDLDVYGNIYVADANRIRKITASTGIITTIAGGGTTGLGDGDTATKAKLGWGVTDVKLDKAGNIIIADCSQYRIRKVDVATGIIQTIAGNGINSFSGDGGSATNASIGGITGIVIDDYDNIFLSEQDGKIRKITAATYIISTISGLGRLFVDNVPAASATIDPKGICADKSGNLFFADQSGRIRRIDATTGIINTLAGNGDNYGGEGGPAINAMIYPENICSDAMGNIYLTDKFRIRKIDAATGNIHTIGGIGVPGFSNDGGPATLARIGYPRGIWSDESGNVYFADGNNKIRRIDATTGIINTVAGNDTVGYSGDGGPATDAKLHYPTSVVVDKTGNIYVSDNGNNRIRKIDAFSGIINTIANQVNPYEMAIDNSGNIYFSESGNNVIKKIDLASGAIAIAAGNGLGGNGNGYGGDSVNGGPAIDAELFNPEGITVDAAGNVFFADYYNNKIKYVNVATGNIYTLAGNGYGKCVFYGMGCPDPILSTFGGGFTGDGSLACNAELHGPSGVCVDASGNVYIADQLNHRIRRISTPTAVNKLPAPSEFNVFPNPTSGGFTVQAGDNQKQNKIEVFNAIGERVYEESFSTSTTHINLSAQPAGVYILYLKSQETTTMQKLIVGH